MGEERMGKHKTKENVNGGTTLQPFLGCGRCYNVAVVTWSIPFLIFYNMEP